MPEEEGKFFACEGTEELHPSVEEALEDFLDGMLEPQQNMAVFFKMVGPIKVVEYQRKRVPVPWLRDQAEDLLTIAAERFFEDFGDVESDDGMIGEDGVLELVPMMMETLRKFVSHGTVCKFRAVGEEVFQPDQVESMMRQTCPHWWDEWWLDKGVEAEDVNE